MQRRATIAQDFSVRRFDEDGKPSPNGAGLEVVSDAKMKNGCFGKAIAMSCGCLAGFVGREVLDEYFSGVAEKSRSIGGFVMQTFAEPGENFRSGVSARSGDHRRTGNRVVSDAKSKIRTIADSGGRCEVVSDTNCDLETDGQNLTADCADVLDHSQRRGDKTKNAVTKPCGAAFPGRRLGREAENRTGWAAHPTGVVSDTNSRF